MHIILLILVQMFSWPGGNVAGNLVASLLWAGPTLIVFIRLHLKKVKKDAKELHAKLDSLHLKLDQLLEKREVTSETTTSTTTTEVTSVGPSKSASAD